MHLLWKIKTANSEVQLDQCLEQSSHPFCTWVLISTYPASALTQHQYPGSVRTHRTSALMQH
jgi:hypothetical protein